MKTMQLRTCAVALVGVFAGSASASPVEEVVKLLTNLEARLRDDDKVEEQSHQRLSCWCKDRTMAKAEGINKAKSDLHGATTAMLEAKSKAATLAAEIHEQQTSLKTREEDGQAQTDMRMKEREAHVAETDKVKKASSSLHDAIDVLSAASKGAFLQRGSATASAALAFNKVESALLAVPDRLLVKGSTSFLSDLQAARASYTPQSGTVVGILREMFTTFNKDLQSALETEAAAQKAFEEFMHTNDQEIANHKKTITRKSTEQAEQEAVVAAKLSLSTDLTEQLKADIAFFDNAKQNCLAKKEVYDHRNAARTEELAGIMRVIEILSNDKSRELFATSISKPESFLQISMGVAANNAFKALKRAASSVHSVRVARIAAEVKTAKVGEFSQVLEKLDTLMASLKVEQAQDNDQYDACKTDIKDSKSKLNQLNWEANGHRVKIDKLAADIDDAQKELDDTIQKKHETEELIAQTEDERHLENTDYLHELDLDKQAVVVLKAARDELAKTYDAVVAAKASATDTKLIQKDPTFEVSEDRAPDVKVSDIANRKHEGDGILALLDTIIEDLQREIRDETVEEARSQLAFNGELDPEHRLRLQEYKGNLKVDENEAQKTSFMAVNTKLHKTLSETITNLDSTLATLADRKSQQETNLDDRNQDIQNEETHHNENIKHQCDFLMTNFENRRSQREAEQKGLVEAKTFLENYVASPVPEDESGTSALQRAAVSRHVQ